MFNKVNTAFLILVLLQGAHSIEEYLGRLWESFPPAELLCSMVSNDLESGFLVINIGLFIFGLVSWIIVFRGSQNLGVGLIWFWIILELVNGIGHPAWSISQRAYTPGLATALLLLASVIYLYRQLQKQDS